MTISPTRWAKAPTHTLPTPNPHATHKIVDKPATDCVTMRQALQIVALTHLHTKVHDMSIFQLQDQMLDTLDALPPCVSAAWLANYHFHRQSHFTLAECLVVAKAVLSQQVAA